MASGEYESGGERRSGGGLIWFWLPLALILFVGGALSVAAFSSGADLTLTESIAIGFGAIAGIVVGVFGAAIGVIVGLFGALLGIVAAGGAVAFTLFIFASPILAIVLLILLLRRGGGGGSGKEAGCPDPGAHE